MSYGPERAAALPLPAAPASAQPASTINPVLAASEPLPARANNSGAWQVWGGFSSLTLAVMSRSPERFLQAPRTCLSAQEEREARAVFSLCKRSRPIWPPARGGGGC